jgi:hypothetical protein
MWPASTGTQTQNRFVHGRQLGRLVGPLARFGLLCQFSPLVGQALIQLLGPQVGALLSHFLALFRARAVLIYSHTTSPANPTQQAAHTVCPLRAAPTRGNWTAMSVAGVRRGKAALSSGCKSHPATAPAGSNRSSHGGNEMAEASG